jgi:hypothetical protein
MLSAEASDTGVSAARRQFSQNAYPRERFEIHRYHLPIDAPIDMGPST